MLPNASRARTVTTPRVVPAVSVGPDSVTSKLCGAAARISIGILSDVTPIAAASKLRDPVAVAPVAVVEARPAASVTTVVSENAEAPSSTLKVTLTPLTGFPNASRARTTVAAEAGVPATTFWLPPLTSTNSVTAPAAAVAVKITGEPESPAANAPMLMSPAGPTTPGTFMFPSPTVPDFLSNVVRVIKNPT